MLFLDGGGRRLLVRRRGWECCDDFDCWNLHGGSFVLLGRLVFVNAALGNTDTGLGNRAMGDDLLS